MAWHGTCDPCFVLDIVRLSQPQLYPQLSRSFDMRMCRVVRRRERQRRVEQALHQTIQRLHRREAPHPELSRLHVRLVLLRHLLVYS